MNATDQKTVRDALTILKRHHRKGSIISSPDTTRQYLQLKLATEYNEVFGCMFLDNRHRIIAVENMFFGTIDGASVHPRVVVQKALLLNAAAIILYHNHPSGVAEPSKADESITKRLQDALKLIDVRILDHIVVSTDETISMAERGLL